MHFLRAHQRESCITVVERWVPEPRGQGPEPLGGKRKGFRNHGGTVPEPRCGKPRGTVGERSLTHRVSQSCLQPLLFVLRLAVHRAGDRHVGPASTPLSTACGTRIGSGTPSASRGMVGGSPRPLRIVLDCSFEILARATRRAAAQTRGGVGTPCELWRKVRLPVTSEPARSHTARFTQHTEGEALRSDATANRRRVSPRARRLLAQRPPLKRSEPPEINSPGAHFVGTTIRCRCSCRCSREPHRSLRLPSRAEPSWRGRRRRPAPCR